MAFFVDGVLFSLKFSSRKTQITNSKMKSKEKRILIQMRSLHFDYSVNNIIDNLNKKKDLNPQKLPSKCFDLMFIGGIKTSIQIPYIQSNLFEILFAVSLTRCLQKVLMVVGKAKPAQV